MNLKIDFNYVVYGNVTVLDLIFGVVIILVSLIISKIITTYLKRAIKHRISKDYFGLIVKLVHTIIIFFVILSVLPLLGVNLAGMLVAGGIVALVIGFASQSTVSNLISGIFLMIDRTVKIGDSVNIGDVSGVIEDISIITTAVRTYDGLYVRLPNEKVFNTNITNYVINVARRFQYTIRIGQNDDAVEAMEIINKLIENHPFALKEPAPSVYVDEIGENSVIIITKIWAPLSEWFNVKTDLLWKIKISLEEQGIEMSFPKREVWFANDLKTERI
ncbi:MAG: mechanosensitive ion channel family protein [Candidatus Thermoplasmatota archaeon]|jgi:small-conductance mechanosensitive channel|nr:mechanosensitive ion channel family protein [Candidatus Thermoplasmatota archaeon]MDP7264818.1 mechanosensitive ion channel family protein [Candidatus Thermoplasmatota archaeon]